MSDVTVSKIMLSESLVAQIKSEIAESIKELGCGNDGGDNAITPDELENAVLNVLIPLSGNRIVSGIDSGARVIPSEEVFNNPEIRLVPLSLIPVTYFIGEGSCYVGSTLGGGSTWIQCRR